MAIQGRPVYRVQLIWGYPGADVKTGYEIVRGSEVHTGTTAAGATSVTVELAGSGTVSAKIRHLKQGVWSPWSNVVPLTLSNPCV